jgi:hypothetical protein
MVSKTMKIIISMPRRCGMGNGVIQWNCSGRYHNCFNHLNIDWPIAAELSSGSGRRGHFHLNSLHTGQEKSGFLFFPGAILPMITSLAMVYL